MIVLCENCDGQFEKKIAEINRTKHNLCSKKCTGERRMEESKARFYDLCERVGECLEWKGFKNKDGYGVKRFRRTAMLSHRVSFLISNGEIPKGMQVLHTCDNPCCVEPSHLWLGTHRENMADMDKKGRRHNNKMLGIVKE